MPVGNLRFRQCLFAAMATVALALVSVAAPGGLSVGSDATPAGKHTYLVMLEDSVVDPAAVARRQTDALGADLRQVYSSALEGYAARMSPVAAESLEGDPQVAHVQLDSPMTLFGPPRAQIIRTGAVDNDNFDIDEVDDARVDVNVAVLDGWVVDTADINPMGKLDCSHPEKEEVNPGYVPPSPEDPLWYPNERLNGEGEPLPYGCLEYTEDPPNTPFTHGSAVAGLLAGIDGFETVGVAPGARRWGLRVVGDQLRLEQVVAAVDWVTATRFDADPSNDIAVANMSIGCLIDGNPYPEYEFDSCDPTVLDAALAESVDAGVVYVGAAGNKDFAHVYERVDASWVAPGGRPDVLTASNMADFDGLPGGEAEANKTCGPSDEEGGTITVADDTLDADSFSGTTVELAAPTPCGGTSGATAEVAGGAAALASQCMPENREDVRFIVDTLMAEGHTGEIVEGGWHDNSGDDWKEPLLDLSDEDVFDPVMVGEEPPTDGCEWRSHPARSDVDGDGRADLVSVDGSGQAQRFEGKFSGIETSSPATSLDLDPALLDEAGDYVLDVADVNGDGASDLVTAGSDSAGVSVHRGQEDGTFKAGVLSLKGSALVLDGSGPAEPIAIADVTGDGLGDMVANGGPYLTVSPGRTDGTFGTWGEGQMATLLGINSALLDGSGEYFLDAADVSGDGRADVISINTNGSAYVFKGKANGEFEAGKATSGVNPVMDDGSGEEPIGLGDVDRDRRADLLTLSGTTLKLRLGNADGSFSAATEPYSGSIDSALLDGKGEELVGLLDYSRDGLADLVSIAQDGTRLTYTARRDLTFAPPVEQGKGAATVSDTASGHELASQKPLIRRAGCTAEGCEWPPKRGAEADVDRDGRSDLVTVDSSGEAEVFTATASGFDLGSPKASLDLDPALLDEQGDYVLDVTDVDGDGRSDLVTAGSDSAGISVHRGKADRGFEAGVLSLKGSALVLDGSGPAEPIGIADVTGDGLGDMVANGGPYLTVSPGRADGTFGTWGEGQMATSLGINSALLDSTGEYFLDAADVSGDGRSDVISINTNGSAYVFKGKANGEFEAGKATSGVNPIMDDGSGEEPIGVADTNGDGRADLLTLSGTTLKLRLGNADGSFATATEPYGSAIDSSLLDGSGLDLIAMLDHSRDGLPDLVALNSSGDVLTYKGQLSEGKFTLASPQTSAGSLVSVQQSSSGNELASQKPLIRRAGCGSEGCDLP
jgi:Subtilase family/FG-GAP-like repeat